MNLWGTAICCMAAVKTYQQLVSLRFVMEVLEPGFADGILLTLSS